MKSKVSIIKIGGNIVDDAAALDRFLSDFHRMKGRKLLVHGGGVMATTLADRLGIATKKINGRRITDAETLQLVTMVYAGWINKSITAALQKLGCQAIGLSGVDAGCIPSVRRPPQPIDFGFVGDPDPARINTSFITQLIEHALVPVFCAVTHDGKGTLLNTNADTVAASLAIALSGEYDSSLYFCFETEGVLRDIHRPESLIPTMNVQEYRKLKQQGIIADGMIPKLDNAFGAIERGVSKVWILHAKNLLSERGTVLESEPQRR